jgi:malonate-semialdehyde dehydrogenase (acetylating) / methylmalonate-semialdehyde dehydrogenase
MIIPRFQATSTAFVEYVPARNWIAGEWAEPSGAEVRPVVNPRHGRAIAEVRFSTAADVDAAVRAARAAFPAWRDLPMRERAQILYRARELMFRDLEELTWLLSHENGKIYDEARAEVLKGIECMEFGCALPNVGQGEQLEVSRGVRCEVTHEPLGVCAGVAPFNFPFMVPLWMIPQALGAGNCFVLKPSEVVPLSACKIAAIFAEAGLPAGVLSLVQGGREVVEALCDHEGIAALGFVGSTAVAKLVYGRACATGKRALCLGGAKNHLIVVPDADLELTAENVVASFTGCAGQRCMAASVLVAVGDVDPIVDAVVARAEKLRVGVDVGPVISEAAVERMGRYVAGAAEQGAKVRLDGRGKRGDEGGTWFGPTVLDGVTPDMPAGCDEIFGPVLSVVRVRTLEEAIAVENGNPYGNASSVYTTSGHVAQQVMRRVEAGMCGVNVGVPVPREPFAFGGWNHSKFGVGDMTGYDGFRFWTRPRKVTTKWALQKDTSWMS